MKILFSYPTQLENEAHLINELIASGGWDLFHLRKPNYSSNELTELWNQLDNDVKNKTVLHKGFKGSCHSFEEVKALDKQLPYCFLSPVFDSISKQGYKAKFDKKELQDFLKKKRTIKIKVIGLGGVTSENYAELLNLGFDGGAFLGSVWKQFLCHSEQSFINSAFDELK